MTQSREQREAQPAPVRRANAQMRASRAEVVEQREVSQQQRDKNKLDAIRRGIADAQTLLRSEEVRIAIASVSLPQLVREHITALVGPETPIVNAQTISSSGNDRQASRTSQSTQNLPVRKSRLEVLSALEQVLKDLQKSATVVSSSAAAKQEGAQGVRNG